MDFGEVLSKAWKITWKFKVLWIFGILASCGTRNGGSFNSSSSSGYQGNGNGFPGSTPNLPPGFVTGMEQVVRFLENPAVIAIFISVICIIVLLSIFIGTLGRIGLIKGASEVDEGAETLTFGGLWNRSLPFFWRIFWLSVLVGLPFFIIFIVMAVGFVAAFIPVMNNNAAGAALLALIPLFCILLCVIFLIAIVIGFIVRMAENAIVIENKNILGGFQRGWDVLIKNIGPILIIWLITAAIGFVAGIVIALPLLIVLVPIFIAFFASGFSGNISYTPLIVAGLCIVAYIPVSLVANGILMTYIQSIWTLTYLRLTKSKLIESIPTALPTNA